MTLNETNCDWLFDMSVKRPHGRALANLFQTFSRQSEGLAMRDYNIISMRDYVITLLHPDLQMMLFALDHEAKKQKSLDQLFLFVLSIQRMFFYTWSGFFLTWLLAKSSLAFIFF